MREIKFRAWHKDMEFMLFVGDDWGTTHPLDCCVYAVQRQPVILMQYTGLKDVNDNEIYEGDLLLIECLGEKVILKVFFNEGLFWAGQVPLIEEYLESKVIGNIYENPEPMP